MIVTRTLVISLLVLTLGQILSLEAQPLRIMPMGNSITYDDNVADKTNPRPVGDKISYRYRLYQLIKAAGYEFDFVGSENCGNNYFQNPEYDDNAGFSGINDAQLAYLISTGYNQRASQYEAPGPYLLYYPTDVILLHIGTNDIDESPNDVEDIIDNIRMYDSDVTIIVARIISRQPYPHAITTAFNNNVEAMVNARGDRHIFMVNMETGAGINYVSDMADYLHPNPTGYNKMAAKWFEALDNINTPPEISAIPEQSTEQGIAFDPLILDNYITDSEEPVNTIKWTATVNAGSKINASIDGNRVLRLTVTDNDWYGSETIKLKAKDAGNGSFRKSDSINVVFTVNQGNEPPQITSEPVLDVNEDEIYNYILVAQDTEPLTYSALQKPSWLNFSSSTHTLTGRPGNSDVGLFHVVLRVSDGDLFTDQEFDITVHNINDPPVITSTPGLSAKSGESYLYELTASDVDIGDTLNFSYVSKPAWLNFTNTNNKGLLFGVPSDANSGANCVILEVNDGHTNVIQGFTIQVTPLTSIGGFFQENFVLFPNPAKNQIYIKTSQSTEIRFLLFDLTGKVLIDIKNLKVSNIEEIDISGINEGIFLYKVISGNWKGGGTIMKTK